MFYWVDLFWIPVCVLEIAARKQVKMGCRDSNLPLLNLEFLNAYVAVTVMFRDS